MQSPAGPTPSTAAGPLPHARPRPAHWAVTAAALAVVIAVATLAGPAADGTPQAPAGPSRIVPAPDPDAARYPLDCGGARPEVVRRASADLDGDGRPETAAVVRCRSGAGTAPSGVYVLAPAATPGEPPRVTATLVDPARRMSVTRFAVTGGTVSATLLGYSTARVPRCCPDLSRAVEWRWQGGKFVLTALPVAGSV
ncbi:hypothetical protein AF335_31745 [Streptomyces eurocidicus]|uniref:Secreted protein n=1 Tax=Streptomyces eurocidicus TaxID=66423 RepID=A0A2N8NMD8_STREU|nr:hypothetical protein [Streptomyces eurocidicus]MBB5120636.1 hypothetical protein [Streptomyces eurocidicus]MBF6054977.1 hypothetical protein [Streptomyces eurocidicus]PNE29932.1 hypothetical protein AF335_31745 [Streptomyces eurocidicus]